MVMERREVFSTLQSNQSGLETNRSSFQLVQLAPFLGRVAWCINVHGQRYLSFYYTLSSKCAFKLMCFKYIL